MALITDAVMYCCDRMSVLLEFDADVNDQEAAFKDFIMRAGWSNRIGGV